MLIDGPSDCQMVIERLNILDPSRDRPSIDIRQSQVGPDSVLQPLPPNDGAEAHLRYLLAKARKLKVSASSPVSDLFAKVR